MTRLCILLTVILFSVYQTEQAYFLEKDYIDRINTQATTWMAGQNFDPNTTEETIKRLLGSIGVEIAKTIKSSEFKTNDVAYDNLFYRIPSEFDARRNWQQCDTIGKVRDQGNCGSCWALGPSAAFADRLCIATDGNFNELLSLEEITFCCHDCGLGCKGGAPIKAWEYFIKYGLVTGGDYQSGEGCQPYGVAPCPIDEYGNNVFNSQPMERNHNCTKTCYGNQNLNFQEDHKFIRDAYYLTYGAIQKDVFAYGPIEASFEVYDDFLSYKTGVYIKSEFASYLGGHSVKLIGWGEEDGVPYWLLINSWGIAWGDNGLFKIRRGTNECKIEDSTTGGVPVV
ncbi:cathepsin B-like cysteine proteinase 4 [Sipha flava]|uniref:Cathepsin B-like cysteine proteinase 4 n=1 Tax=Sipha flava TaxID=143950 RepID=A0A8B8FAV0_9HEMI|nr:cathepsin B-like cysteine proteinase 4 [Sipha flava]